MSDNQRIIRVFEDSIGCGIIRGKIHCTKRKEETPSSAKLVIDPRFVVRTFRLQSTCARLTQIAGVLVCSFMNMYHNQ
jgi:hypothetical protein